MKKTLHQCWLLALSLLLLSACSDETFDKGYLLSSNPLTINPEEEIAFVHITDTHASDISLVPAIYFLERTDCTFGIHSGDVMATRAIKNDLRQCEKPFLVVPGNHDAKTDVQYATGQHAFRTEVLNVIGQPGYATFADDVHNYWYRDFHTGNYTLRVIGIDQFEQDEFDPAQTTSESVHTQQQIDWLINLLEQSGSADALIIVMHEGYGNRDTWPRDRSVTNEFISLYAADYDNAYDYYGLGMKLVPDIINAYQTGENLIGERYANANKDDFITVTTHFTEPHNNFVGYFGGHAHWDMVEPLTHYPRQLQVLMAYCGRGTGSRQNDLLKTRSGNSSYNFNVNVINFRQRQLKIIRKGANIKIDGTTRDSIQFTY